MGIPIETLALPAPEQPVAIASLSVSSIEQQVLSPVPNLVKETFQYWVDYDNGSGDVITYCQKYPEIRRHLDGKKAPLADKKLAIEATKQFVPATIIAEEIAIFDSVEVTPDQSLIEENAPAKPDSPETMAQFFIGQAAINRAGGTLDQTSVQDEPIVKLPLPVQLNRLHSFRPRKQEVVTVAGVIGLVFLGAAAKLNHREVDNKAVLIPAFHATHVPTAVPTPTRAAPDRLSIATPAADNTNDNLGFIIDSCQLTAFCSEMPPIYTTVSETAQPRSGTARVTRTLSSETVDTIAERQTYPEDFQHSSGY